MDEQSHLPDRRSGSTSILRPGETCWRQENADRIAVAIDGEAYFRAFREACEQAKHSIFVLGWDFDRREKLGRGPGIPRIGTFLCQLLRENPRLHIYLLMWDFHLVYAAERELFQAWRLRLQGYSRLHVQLDGQHPIGGSQHQKLVVIDDALAFCGGIDLSRWRWDTTEHNNDDPRRVDPDGEAYPPFHDMMLAVSGDVASALGELARRRWADSGSQLEPVKTELGTHRPWPQSLEPMCRDHKVGIARTCPGGEGRDAIREVEALYLEGVAAARHYIYIENQYFTSKALTRALVRRLRESGGPEVVLVLPHHTGGWLEQATMDVLRGRMLARLKRVDRHNRLRVYYPHRPGLGEDCISVHSKLMIVDDRLLRVGSANTSNRSMGLDSECDLALEARGENGHNMVRKLRNRLLAEHLGADPKQISESMSQNHSLIDTINTCNNGPRSLRQLPLERDPVKESLLPDDKLVDPDEPIDTDYFVNRFVPRSHRSVGRRHSMLLLGLIVLLLAAAIAWRWTPLAEWLDAERIATALRVFDDPVLRAVVIVVTLVFASLLMLPLTVLIVASSLILGAWEGFVLALIGALISAGIAFTLGQLLSRDLLTQITGSRVERLSRRISKQGTLAIIVLRLVPIAPFTIFNLIAGASHLKPGQFLLGSALGLAPGILAISLFSESLYQAVTDPGLTSLGVLAVVAALLIGVTFGLRRVLRSS